jgi:hypothetical protein
LGEDLSERKKLRSKNNGRNENVRFAQKELGEKNSGEELLSERKNFRAKIFQRRIVRAKNSPVKKFSERRIVQSKNCPFC